MRLAHGQFFLILIVLYEIYFVFVQNIRLLETWSFDNSGTHTHQNFLNNESKKKMVSKKF